MTDYGPPWSIWITVERVLLLHQRGLDEHDGASGPSDPSACVEGCLGGANSAETYLEGRRHLKAGLSFAAHLLFYLAQNHCFVDGNKRVAWAAAMDVLSTMGLGIVASDDEAETFVSDIIAHRVATGDHAAAWMASRLYATSS